MKKNSFIQLRAFTLVLFLKIQIHLSLLLFSSYFFLYFFTNLVSLNTYGFLCFAWYHKTTGSTLYFLRSSSYTCTPLLDFNRITWGDTTTWWARHGLHRICLTWFSLHPTSHYYITIHAISPNPQSEHKGITAFPKLW